MTPRGRVVTVAVVSVVAVGAAVGVGAHELQRSRAERSAPSDVAVAARGAFDAAPHIVFRSTAPGNLYGRVSIVPVSDPSGPRDVTPAACDRVDAIAGHASCLRIERGIATTFSANLLDSGWKVVESWPLPGVPSRTRLSADGTRLATTAFVTGDSYASTGFSTRTVIHDVGDGAPAASDPADSVDIETYRLVVDGHTVAPVDRNMWGVTFVDDTTFYATAQSQLLGHTWLVKGDTTTRTLTAVADGVECPSISPDRTQIAFKRDVVAGRAIHWTPALYDIASGKITLLGAETRSIDDQIEWLDDDTILYGVPRPDQAAVTDVWELGTDPASVPKALIPEAWSPSVVR